VSKFFRGFIKELPLLKKLFIERGVERWQFQIGRPMGNLNHYPELILCAEDIEGLVNFCHEAMKEGEITIDLADCIGYYSLKDVELRKRSHRDSDGVWRGCGAGKEVIGIRANGDISGCLSIRDDNFIEGNIRKIPLADLWARRGAFAWNRGQIWGSGYSIQVFTILPFHHISILEYYSLTPITGGCAYAVPGPGKWDNPHKPDKPGKPRPEKPNKK
jgi:hypothetical protein